MSIWLIIINYPKYNYYQNCIIIYNYKIIGLEMKNQLFYSFLKILVVFTSFTPMLNITPPHLFPSRTFFLHRTQAQSRFSVPPPKRRFLKRGAFSVFKIGRDNNWAIPRRRYEKMDRFRWRLKAKMEWSGGDLECSGSVLYPGPQPR